MRRRALVASLASAAIMAPRLGFPQQRARPARIGVITSNPRNPVGSYRGLFAGLRDVGLIEGANLVAHVVESEQSQPALFAAVAEMVRTGPQLLVVSGPELPLRAAVSAAPSLPIVIIAINYDPIALGYAQTLARPGGNVTGVFVRQPELAEKQVELLSQAFPDRRRLGILFDALSGDQLTAAERRATTLGLEAVPFKLENPPYDFAAAFDALAARAAQFLIVLSSPLFTPSRERIAQLAVQHRLPSMFIFKAYVEAGGLMSYGYEAEKAARRAAVYVKKILDGAKPAELPIEQPTTYQLVINLKTADALGLSLPQSLLARADEVIE
jgi:putative tryptophan/tyrosine transport system substrate-binding protein